MIVAAAVLLLRYETDASPIAFSLEALANNSRYVFMLVIGKFAEPCRDVKDYLNRKQKTWAL
jgi:hypothetical protein